MYSLQMKKSLLVLRHLERQQKHLGLSMEKVALDRGYDTGAVHRGLELLGMTGYIPAIRFPNNPSKYGFSYNPKQDTLLCPMGQPLVYHRLNCNQSTWKYLRCCQVQGDVCRKCTSRKIFPCGLIAVQTVIYKRLSHWAKQCILFRII